MSNIDKDIIVDFVNESKVIIEELLKILEEIEGDFSQVARLADYGQKVDRIMGGAKSLALLAAPGHGLYALGDYADLCKAVGYKASQIKGNSQFFDICVALLFDATEALEEGVENLTEEDGGEGLRKTLSATFLERLRWVSNQFDASVRASVSAGGNAGKLDQGDIDSLLRKLGVG
jgi:hypothetical protein